MEYLLIAISFLVLGVICAPLLIFLRARRDKHWDDSNMTNIYRVVAHLATHPADFGLFQYKDGSKPFWYIAGDEFTDIVKTRPKNEQGAQNGK